MYCNICGNKLDESMAFCPRCGAKAIRPDQQPVSQQPAAQQPAAQQPVSQQLTSPQSVNQQLAYQQPVNQQPMNQQSEYQQSSYKQQSQALPKKKMSTGVIIGIIAAVIGIVILMAIPTVIIFRKSFNKYIKTARSAQENANITSEELTTEEVTTEATESTTEVTEAQTEIEATTESTTEAATEADPQKAVKDAYLNLLSEHADKINNYKWQLGYNSNANSPIAIEDIDGDGTPELIFMEAENEYAAGFSIYGYENNAVKQLYEYTQIDVEVAGGSVFYIGKLKDGAGIFVYHSVTDEGSEEIFYTVSKDDETGNYKKGKEYVRSAYPNEDYSGMNVTYKKKDKEISEEKFESYVNKKQDAIECMLMVSEGEDIANLASSKGCVSLTLDEATAKLKGSDSGEQSQSQPQDSGSSEVQLPIDTTMGFVFASGAGAWGTSLAVDKNGIFAGNYHDSDMGDTGDGYPNGTVYVSNFDGKFKNITKIDDYTYKMELDYYNTEKNPGTDEILDEIRYVYSEPYGIEGGKTFYLYLPGKPTSELSEDFIGWGRGVVGDISADPTLKYYGLYNEEMKEGFFVYQY